MNRTAKYRFGWLPVLASAVLACHSSGVRAAAEDLGPDASVRELSAQRGIIRIDIAGIPQAPADMPLLELSTIKPAQARISELLRSSAPNAGKFELLSRSGKPLAGASIFAPRPKEVLVAREKQTVAAYVDLRNGNFEIAPQPAALKPITAAPEAAARVAAKIFAGQDFIPKDDTRLAIAKPAVLFGETFVRPGSESPFKAEGRQAFLVSVAAQRYVGDFPVYGPGSRASVAVGDNERVHGLVHWWKAARVISRVKPAYAPETVLAVIRRQLEPVSAGADVTVDSVALAYYDGNGAYMQPVYRFTATIEPKPLRPVAGEKVQVLTSHLIGYVPFGDTREAIPSLADKPEVTPVAPSGTGVPPVTRAPLRGDPTVGRYVVRNDNPNWVANANEFWGGLTFFAPLAANFTNSQYYWAYPWEYTSSRNSFVNSVNVALTEGHGDWWLFSTLRNCCDLVDINTIPGGYGSVVGGKLRFWAIHSCEVVPAPEDTATWANPWWNVFKGLHSVVGYRTIMYIDDDIGFPFGFKLALGVPVVSAWLSTVHGASAYAGNPHAIAHGGINRPMGRASTISVCGREGDTVYDATNIGAASCLRVFWYPD